jgi:hypothetical protein
VSDPINKSEVEAAIDVRTNALPHACEQSQHSSLAAVDAERGVEMVEAQAGIAAPTRAACAQTAGIGTRPCKVCGDQIAVIETYDGKQAYIDAQPNVRAWIVNEGRAWPSVKVHVDHRDSCKGPAKEQA